MSGGKSSRKYFTGLTNSPTFPTRQNSFSNLVNCFLYVENPVCVLANEIKAHFFLPLHILEQSELDFVCFMSNHDNNWTFYSLLCITPAAFRFILCRQAFSDWRLVTNRRPVWTHYPLFLWQTSNMPVSWFPRLIFEDTSTIAVLLALFGLHYSAILGEKG